MELSKYLKRIGIEEDLSSQQPSIQLLTQIIQSHLLNVPFEGIDSYRRKPMRISVEDTYKKIVEQGRGGFCMEVNILLNWCLNLLGFQSQLIPSSVNVSVDHLNLTKQNINDIDRHALPYSPNTHVFNRVFLNGEYFLVDVGFGDNANFPLKWIFDIPQTNQDGRSYMLKKILDEKGEYFYLDHSSDYGRLNELCSWFVRLRWKEETWTADQFSSSLDYICNNPNSLFRKSCVVTMVKQNNLRITLFDRKFVQTDLISGQKTTRTMETNEEIKEILASVFNITNLQDEQIYPLNIA